MYSLQNSCSTLALPKTHLKGNTSSKLAKQCPALQWCSLQTVLTCFVYNVQIKLEIWTCQAKTMYSKASLELFFTQTQYFATLLRNTASHPKMLAVSTTPSQYEPWVTTVFALTSIATVQIWQYKAVTHLTVVSLMFHGAKVKPP
jgi:hypothetical protein